MKKNPSLFPLCFLLLLFLLTLGTGRVTVLWGQEEKEVTPNVETKSAIEKGLAFLAQAQKQNGSFGPGYPVAITALVGMAFLAHGDTPRTGRYARNIREAIRYLLEHARRDGYITEANNQSQMHGHGFALTFLASAYGELPETDSSERQKIKTVVKKGIQLIENHQSKEGGWTYQPIEAGEENSVVVAIVTALRAVREAGFAVNPQVIQKGVAYMEACGNPDGTFCYNSGSRTTGSIVLSALGVSVLYLYGHYHSDKAKQGLKFLLANKDQPAWLTQYGLFGAFYGSFAFYQSQNRKIWSEWYDYISKFLLTLQKDDGPFDSPGNQYGPEFNTAFALLILEMPYKFFPLYLTQE